MTFVCLYILEDCTHYYLEIHCMLNNVFICPYLSDDVVLMFPNELRVILFMVAGR
jgi:hypothetical protein